MTSKRLPVKRFLGVYSRTGELRPSFEGKPDQCFYISYKDIKGEKKVWEKAPEPPVTTKLSWSGEIPTQKWMNFYTKILSKYAVGNEMKITLNVEIRQTGGISSQKIEETKTALRELGMGDEVKTD